MRGQGQKIESGPRALLAHAHAKKGSDYCGAGGTGFGVRLLCELLDRL
jgi:hypothetical protein